MSNLAIIDQNSLLKTAEMISKSDIVPKAYQGKPGNVYLVLELAKRLNMDSLTLLNNVDIIYGKPCFKSSFLIALANSSGMLSERITFATHGEGLNETSTCRKVTAKAVLKNGQIIEYTVDAGMAIKEGWATKNGSKYHTMLDLMLSYRAAAFLCRLYLPEISCMMYTREEIEDIHSSKEYIPQKQENKQQNNVINITPIKDEIPKQDLNSKFQQMNVEIQKIVNMQFLEHVGKYDIDKDFSNNFKHDVLTYIQEQFMKSNGSVNFYDLFMKKLIACRLNALAVRYQSNDECEMKPEQIDELKRVVYNEFMKDQTVNIFDLFMQHAKDFIPF